LYPEVVVYAVEGTTAVQLVMESVIAFGISERASVVDTINTGEPRTLADVIFRNDEYFNDLSKGERAKIAKVAEHAIRLLGHRTAAFKDAFSPNQTHPELIEFLHRHARLLKCVRHIYDSEIKESHSISSIVPLSTAAALMYLQGCSGGDCKRYLDNVTPNEGMLDWSLYKTAEDFWALIGDSNGRVFAIKEAISVAAQNTDSVSRAERIGFVIKAWQFYSALPDQVMGPEHLALEYREESTTDTHGNTVITRSLAEHPKCCAIDFVSPKDAVEDEPEAEPEEAADDETAAAVKPAKGKKTAATGLLNAGDSIWVLEDPIDGSWQAKVVDPAKMLVECIAPKSQKGKQFTIRPDQVRLTKPKAE
jgi:hypothetical protein